MSRKGRPHRVAGGPLAGLDRAGADPAAPVAVLLHGFGGDERAMWVFESALPTAWRLIALRGLSPAKPTGFRWHRGVRWPPPPAEVFSEAVGAVRGSLALLDVRAPVVWIGFSQGAALSFCCIAAGLPTRAVVSLAGYLPKSLGTPPAGLPVFWSHGRSDDHVPVARARSGVERLTAHGAEVEYCETDTGHKVGAACLRALRAWLTRFDAPSDA